MGAPHICPVWLAYTFDNPLRKLFHKPDRLLAPYVRPGMTVADIGCGLGYFSLGMAAMVGTTGLVLAIDLQSGMLDRLHKRALRAGMDSRIETRQCTAENIGLNEPVDFVLAFWMVHETMAEDRFFRQVHEALKPSGVLLVSEPRLHVSATEFDRELASAEAEGFCLREKPEIAFSRAAALIKR